MSKTTMIPPEAALAFGKNVSTEAVFAYPQFEELQALLKMSLSERSMALVTGKAGIGKTTGIRSFTSGLPSSRYTVIYFGQDQDGVSFLRRFAYALGFKPKHFRIQLPMQISQALHEKMHESGKEIVAVVDEAHLFDSRTLEDIRLLTNSEFDTQSPLSVVMVGQQLLRMKLKAPELEALNQRLRYRFFLEGFSCEETAAYIKHRLSSAGFSQDLFTDDAIQKIFDASEGVLREINNLCALALIKAQASGSDRVDGKLIKLLVSQLDLS
ncbi:MAG: ExeA family protein [Candidatus Micrarchaeaceae archaeon]